MAHESAKRMTKELGRNKALSPLERIENKRKQVESLDKAGRAKDLEALHIRRWKTGDVYAPHDLSSVEMRKWRQKHQSNTDVFDALAINPLHEYKVCIRHIIVIAIQFANASFHRTFPS